MIPQNTTTSDPIRSAILIVSNKDSSLAKYGGESLLNRSLVALNKSGIMSVWIVAEDRDIGDIKNHIRSVDHRLSLVYRVVSKSGMSLSRLLSSAGDIEGDFLIFESDKIVHPTFLRQAVQRVVPDRSILFCYKGVWQNDHRAVFEPSFKEKFKIIFQDPSTLSVEPASDWPECSPAGDFYSTEIIAANRIQLSQIPNFDSVSDMVRALKTLKLLKLDFVSEAWWLKIHPDISRSQIKDFFWGIAFKEISGEFSKAVNSKLSKPLSFWFARHGFAPNTISNLQLFGFIISAPFLLIDARWATAVFAVIWQFSAGVLDRCDGETARIRNYESESGAKYDVLIDDLRFGLPFIFLTGLFYYQSQNLIYLIVLVLLLAWLIGLTLYEQYYMRRAGYLSRQVLYADYLKLQGVESRKTTAMKKYIPFIKGDVRTFYVFLFALFGLREFVFWLLLVYMAFVPVVYSFGARKYAKVASQV